MMSRHLCVRAATSCRPSHASTLMKILLRSSIASCAQPIKMADMENEPIVEFWDDQYQQKFMGDFYGDQVLSRVKRAVNISIGNDSLGTR